MAVTPRDAFDRTFSRREFSVGAGRIAIVWSILGGCLLAILLLEIGLLIGLLVDRGRIVATVPSAELARFDALTGVRQLDVEPEAKPADDKPAEGAFFQPDPTASEAPAAPPPDAVRTLEDTGVFPSLWRNRHSWWGRSLLTAYERCWFLRDNGHALISVLLLIALTWLLRMAVLGQLRMTCRKSALDVTTQLRRQLHRQAIRLGAEDLDGRDSGTAVDLFTTQVDRIRHGLFDWLYRITRSPAELIALLVVALSVEVLLTLQWCLLLILGWFVWRKVQQAAEHRRAVAADRSQLALKRLAAGLHEGRIVRGYGLEAQQQEQFQQQMTQYLAEVRVQSRVQDDPLWLRLVGSVLIAGLGAFLLFIVCAKVLANEISAPGAFVFLTAIVLTMRVAGALRRIGAVRADVAAAADHVWRYLDRLPTVSQAVGARFIDPVSKTLHFEGVTLDACHRSRLLDRLELKLTAGRTYAVLSLDPLEAKAFVSLLPRFVEPTAGRVLFDGEDIAWGTLESLRAETMYVSADDPALPGSVLDNIRAGRPEATMTQVTEAAKEAHAHNFISRLPQGYETILTGRDDALDGSQRYRLALSRALLRNPALLILEEPDERLDEDAKHLLDDTYARICKGRTVFFVPRRLTTVKRADDILFLHKGRVEAMGPRDLLVAESPRYRHWEYLNFNEFRHESAG